MIENFESNTGAKVINAKEMIIEYDGEQWRPIKNQVEFLCACFDNVPFLRVGDYPFVSADYQS